MKILKKINFYQKLDLFLLLNYPSVWSMRLHYVFIISILFSLFLFLYPFKLYQIPYTYPYLLYIVLIFFAYWLFKQREFVTSKEYTKALISARSEFLLYIITIFFFFLPLFTMLMVSDNLIESKLPFASKKIDLKYIEFDESTLKYKCTYNKKEFIYNYDDEGKEFCPISEERMLLLETLITSLSTVKNIERVDTRTLKSIKNRCSTLEGFNLKVYIENILLWIFFYIPFFIIYFKHSNSFEKKWFFIPIYWGILLFIMVQLENVFTYLNDETMTKSIENSMKLNINHFIINNDIAEKVTIFVSYIFASLLLSSPLIILYIYMFSYRLVIFFQITILNIIILQNGIIKDLFTIQFDFYFLSLNGVKYLIAILIMLFIIKPIRDHIIFLSTEPKKE